MLLAIRGCRPNEAAARAESDGCSADRGWFYAAYGPGEQVVLTNSAALDVDAIYARASDLPAD